MSNQITAMIKANNQETAQAKRIKIRKHLNADSLLATMRSGFEKVKDNRPGKVEHTLADTLMAGFAMFSLNDPSLRTFGVFTYLMNGDLQSHTTSKTFTA